MRSSSVCGELQRVSLLAVAVGLLILPEAHRPRAFGCEPYRWQGSVEGEGHLCRFPGATRRCRRWGSVAEGCRSPSLRIELAT